MTEKEKVMLHFLQIIHRFLGGKDTLESSPPLSETAEFLFILCNEQAPKLTELKFGVCKIDNFKKVKTLNLQTKYYLFITYHHNTNKQMVLKIIHH